MVYGTPPHTGVDYYFGLGRLQSRLRHGQPYARVDLNHMPESTLSPSQGLRIWPQVSHSSTITHTDERPPYIASPLFQLQLSDNIVLLKGTVSGGFRLLVLFMNQFPPST
jgi:hypothetical protein